MARTNEAMMVDVSMATSIDADASPITTTGLSIGTLKEYSESEIATVDITATCVHLMPLSIFSANGNSL